MLIDFSVNSSIFQLYLPTYIYPGCDEFILISSIFDQPVPGHSVPYGTNMALKHYKPVIGIFSIEVTQA